MRRQEGRAGGEAWQDDRMTGGGGGSGGGAGGGGRISRILNAPDRRMATRSNSVGFRTRNAIDGPRRRTSRAVAADLARSVRTSVVAGHIARVLRHTPCDLRYRAYHPSLTIIT